MVRFKRLIFSLLCALSLILLTVYSIGPRSIAIALGLVVGSGGRRSNRRSPVSPSAAKLAGSRKVRSGGDGCCGPPGSASLVWVMLGDSHFQPYLMESITQARIFNPTDFFFVVVDAAHLNDTHPWCKQMDDLNVSARVIVASAGREREREAIHAHLTLNAKVALFLVSLRSHLTLHPSTPRFAALPARASRASPRGNPAPPPPPSPR